MKIQKGSTVKLDYILKNGDGQEVESTAEDGPVSYKHGDDEILPGLESALEGHEEGDRLEVTLDAADAYGEYDPEGIFTVPRSELPEDFEGETDELLVIEFDEDEIEPDGPGELEVRVVEVHPEHIVVDANHPLAGQRLTFEVTVRSVA
ncbi:MAG: FKBP-type peptidyl-prolyl cis-trans isomerase [Planctomycetota bacterium]